MVEIYIDGRIADWDSETGGINLVKEFITEDSLSETQAEWSYELLLPATETNAGIFGYKHEIDVPNKFQAVHTCVVADGGVTLFDGNLYLAEISKEYYSCNLYKKGKKPLSDVLGDVKMRDIIPHYMTVGTLDDIRKINDDYTNDSPGADPHAVFPYVLYNLPINPKGDDRKWTQVVEGSMITDENSYPAFDIRSVVKDVFATFGYKVGGNFFTDPRFRHLYQTVKNGEWNEKRITPNYLSFRVNYDNALSDSVVVRTGKYNMKNGYDDILQAGLGAVITRTNDTNNMMTFARNQQGRETATVTIPKTGWYRLSYSGNITMSDGKNRYWTNQARDMKFPSVESDKDCVSLDYNPIEFTITKEDNMEYVSTPFFEEYRPYEQYVLGNSHSALVNSRGELSDSRKHRFPTNGGTMELASDSVVGGVRFGCYKGVDTTESQSDRIPAENRNHYEANALNLPDPDKQVEGDTYHIEPENASNDSQNDVRFIFSMLGGGSWRETTYGRRTALAIYNRANIHSRIGETFFDAYTRTWEKADDSLYDNLPAPTVESSGRLGGDFSVDDVVYLKKGDQLRLNLNMPFQNYGVANTIGSNFHDQFNQGIVRTTMELSMEIGFVSDNDQYWTPSASEDFSVDGSGRPTNMNQFLGDDTCRDWMANLATTFNLKVTSAGDGAYDVDVPSPGGMSTNVVSIDDYCNPRDAVFKRVDAPSAYRFRFTVDKGEVGWDETGKDGSLDVENHSNTAGDENVVESKYSFDWFLPLDFEGADGTERLSVPVVAPAERWTKNSYTRDSALKDGDWREGTPRLLYIPPAGDGGFISYAHLPLLKSYPRGEGMSLGYDDDMVGNLFTLALDSAYEVKVELPMPQSLYSAIGRNSLIRFNDNLYRPRKIDAYDVTGGEPCELTMASV